MLGWLTEAFPESTPFGSSHGRWKREDGQLITIAANITEIGGSQLLKNYHIDYAELEPKNRYPIISYMRGKRKASIYFQCCLQMSSTP